MGKKLAVIFPGIGYHTDKPLLYYAKKLAVKHGYQIVEVAYQGFRKDIKGNAYKMQEAFESALRQTENQLAEQVWPDTDEILFISKSIGTIVAAAYAKKAGLRVRQIYFTPLKETFLFAERGNGIAFHGTSDPWAADADVQEGCEEHEIPLVTIPEGNHSLETGDVFVDIRNLLSVMEEVENYMSFDC